MRKGSCTTRAAITPSLSGLDELVVAVEADQLDLVLGLVLGDRLDRALRHDQVRGEDAAQVRVGGEQVGRDVETAVGRAVGDLVGDQLEARILGGELLLEALGALVERADARQVGDQRDVALGLAVLGA